MTQGQNRQIFSTRFLIAVAAIFWCCTTEASAQTVPSTAVPTGYGRYCSVTYPNGTWGLINRPSPNSDPCAELLKPGSGGKVQRAGLWGTARKNNVLRTCDGDVGAYVGTGNEIIKAAFQDGLNKRNCIFTISPLMLRVFSRPYQTIPGVDLVQVANRHNYNFYGRPINITDYGQQPNPDCPNSTAILRDGRQVCRPHGGYDLNMPTGVGLKAVADGIVRKARWRDTTQFNNTDCKNKSPQGEIYVEHQIGPTGRYSERFITYYAHLSKIDVKTGDRVTRGQVIGKSGDSGCSGGPHLHFAVARTTNLSGYYRLDPTYPETGYGISTPAGFIDHFHWTAPRGVDPWAGISLGSVHDPVLNTTVINPGAFSLWLWREGQEPEGN